MFKKFTTSLTKPPLAIFFIKDSWVKIFLYIFILPIVMIIPSVFMLITQPAMTQDMYQETYQLVQSKFRFDDASISDYKLTYTETKSFSTATYDICMGTAANSRAVSFVFVSNGISVEFMDQKLDFHSYAELGLEFYDFSSTQAIDIHTLTLVIQDVYQSQYYIHMASVIQQYLWYVVDYLVVIIIMAFMSSLMAPMLRMPFAMRFKLSTYLSTIYVFANLIAILLGIAAITYISIIFVYIYHIWVFRSIKVVPKGVA